MFTRNYWLYQAAKFANNTSSIYGQTTKPKYITWNGAVGANRYNKDDSSYYYTKGKVTPEDPYVCSGYPRFSYSDFGVKTSSGSYSPSSQLGSYGVIFGTGNTPATIDDYKFAGDVISGCSCSSTVSSFNEEDGSLGSFVRTYTITNNNDTEITIGEIGMYFEMYWMTGYTDYTSYPVLVERTPLETPITIPSGGVGKITYTISANYPTA